ncbi:MAG: hypothetical protein HYZ10_05655 [Ignavibacteriales bacterium]|nr:hypothetical protein [Ignavibacteriales bacterium]
MEENNNSMQEKFYGTINKALSDAIRLLKYAVYPLVISLIIVVVVWGVDIIKLHAQLENIKSGLDLKIQEIDVKQRETNLIAEEKLNILKKRLSSIDSSFSLLESEYKSALMESNEELNKLKNNSRNVGNFSKSINNELTKSLKDFKDTKIKYSSEIQYATKGAELRKQDTEKMYQQSKVLLLSLLEIIENTNLYINENVKGLLAASSHDQSKVKELNAKLKDLLAAFRKQLEN